MSTRTNTLGAAAGVVAPSAVESAPKALVNELELQVDFVRQRFREDGCNSQMQRTTPTWRVYAGENDLRLPQPVYPVPRRHAFGECCAHQRRVTVSSATQQPRPGLKRPYRIRVAAAGSLRPPAAAIAGPGMRRRTCTTRRCACCSASPRARGFLCGRTVAAGVRRSPRSPVLPAFTRSHGVSKGVILFPEM